MSIELIKFYADNGTVPLSLIEKIENQLSVIFPSSYKKFIQQHNAAYLDNGDFDYWNTYFNQEGTKNFNFFGFGYKEGLITASTSLIDHQDFDVYGYDHVVAFGATAEGDYVCFDYRDYPDTSEPKIAVMIHDYYDKETGKMAICPVAESFDEFCTLLYEYNDEE